MRHRNRERIKLLDGDFGLSQLVNNLVELDSGRVGKESWRRHKLGLIMLQALAHAANAVCRRMAPLELIETTYRDERGDTLYRMSKWRETALFWAAIASGVGGIAATLLLFGVSFKVEPFVVPSHGLLAAMVVVLYLVTIVGLLYFRILRNRELAKTASETSRADETLERLRETANDLNTSLARQEEVETELRTLKRQHSERPIALSIAGAADLHVMQGAVIVYLTQWSK